MTGTDAWRMPAETEPHACTWMAWPSHGYTLGDTDAEADEARATWAAVARAVAAFEPVRMVVDPAATGVARDVLGSDVELLEAPLDDAWMRDIWPTFVVSGEYDPASRRLGAVDWVFNGWGRQSWATWERDARIGRRVAEWAGAAYVPSTLVNEGGGLHVDGQGTVLVTETVQLDPGRNPGLSRDDVALELRSNLHHTPEHTLTRRRTRDYADLGTRGHVDIVATMPAPGTVLLHRQRSPEHPDHGLWEELRSALDPTWTVRELPAPEVLRDDEGVVDWSYVNHLACNGGVVACTFDDPADAEALEVLRSAYPGREVVGVDARPLFARGGGIHCLTQQQPLTGTP